MTLSPGIKPASHLGGRQVLSPLRHPCAPKSETFEHDDKDEFSLQVLVFAAIAAILLLISSSLIADDAREFKPSWSIVLPGRLDKLRAAAVSHDQT